MLKSSKTFYYIEKLYSNVFSNPRGGSLALEAGKNDKNFQKTWKKQVSLKKLLKFVILKVEKLFHSQLNFSVNYYQTP